MTSAPAAGDGFRSVFRHRAFALFWSARVCSRLTIRIQVVAVGLAGLWAAMFPALRRVDRLLGRQGPLIVPGRA